ncbi:MAG: hypothetical protein JJE50_10615 [Actinomycetales bacterium]|nr:hypothetical protein [Actinomycetales bacterium]
MSDAGRLVGFGLVLAVALGVGYGVGAAVGPTETDPQDTTVVETGGDMPADHN